MINFNFKFKNKDIQLSWTNLRLLGNNLLGQLSNLGQESEYIPDQLNNSLSGLVYSIEEEYNKILSKLENIEFTENPVIVDIGAGSGIVDLVLSKYFEGKATFYLVDGNDDLSTIERDQNKMIHSAEFKTSNNWRCIKDGMISSKVDQSKFHYLSPSDDWSGIEADLVMSIGSCGLHYPVEQYWERIKGAVQPNGYLCFFPLLHLNTTNLMREYYGPALLHNTITFGQIKEKRANDYSRWLELWPHVPNDNEEWAAHKIWRNNRLTP